MDTLIIGATKAVKEFYGQFEDKKPECHPLGAENACPHPSPERVPVFMNKVNVVNYRTKLMLQTFNQYPSLLLGKSKQNVCTNYFDGLTCRQHQRRLQDIANATRIKQQTSHSNRNDESIK